MLYQAILALACISAFLLLAPEGARAAEAEPSPSCAQGPVTVERTTYGTPCADTIVVPSTVTSVEGGGGNDTIIATSSLQSCPAPCRLGVGSQTFEGGPGNDIVFGERGNDILRGGEGNDRLYGGIGDDLLQGGPGDDVLVGGWGADGIDGEGGSDFVRGDTTQDEIVDTGTEGVDTLSYATGATPGFTRAVPGTHSGFPAGGEGRGVYLDLAENIADNGVAADGGGVDHVEGSDFERIIGTPFSDYIVGSKPGQTIYGGGGGDILEAGGAGTTLDGGANGDDCVGGASTVGCESTSETGSVSPPSSSLVSVGRMVPADNENAELYVVGSSAADSIEAVYGGGEVVFHVSGAGLDATATTEGGCVVRTATEAACGYTGTLDSLVLAGLDGNDKLVAGNFPPTASIFAFGNAGADELTGGQESEDVLVDGSGNDNLSALGGDDALANNQGRDTLNGGDGNDLLFSNSICEGDAIVGGEGRDNASWAKFGEGVEARLDEGVAGRPGASGEAECAGGSLGTISGVEDLEGSPNTADVLYGDEGENQLLGWRGSDSYFAEGGDDRIFANSGDDDAAIDCGEGNDVALIDRRPAYNDPVPVNCEVVQEADPGSFRVITELPPEVAPEPPPPAARPVPPPDRRPPATSIRRHPPKLVRSRTVPLRVSFAFRSSEAGSRFRCRMDRRPFRPCTSPGGFRVGQGRHTFAVFAIDRAGNRDPSPATFRFRVQRVRAR